MDRRIQASLNPSLTGGSTLTEMGGDAEEICSGLNPSLTGGSTLTFLWIYRHWETVFCLNPSLTGGSTLTMICNAWSKTFCRVLILL